MLPLIIGADEKQTLKKLKQFAEDHPMTMDDLLDILNGGPAPGDREGYTCFIPFGFRVVFTIEPNRQGNKIRRVSVSIASKRGLPSFEAVEMIMEELGFINKINSGKCKVFIEEEAINIAELI